MPYRVELARPANSQIRALSAQAQQRIKPAIDALADAPRPSGVMKLADGAYRIRVGAYRVIYDVDDKARVIVILRVRHRRDVYRRR